MQRASHSEREKFVALIQQHAGGDAAQRYSFAQRLMRYGATYGRLQEALCNGPHYVGLADHNKRIQAEWQRRQDAIPTKEAKIEAAVSELCKTFECSPIFSGDPRGNTLKIEVKSGYSNSFGGEGICVPTS
jgi:hypothetical protein